MKHLLIAGACALVLAGCATTPANYHTQAEKVLLTAEGTYNAAAKAQLAVCGRPIPLMPRSAQCAKGDALRHDGLKALKVARAAYNDGSMPDTASLMALALQLTTLFPPKGQ